MQNCLNGNEMSNIVYNKFILELELEWRRQQMLSFTNASSVYQMQFIWDNTKKAEKKKKKIMGLAKMGMEKTLFSFQEE